MAWRLLVALILAICLVPIGSSPAAALSAEDLFQITYEISLSAAEVNGSEIFYVTVQGAARCEEDLEIPYNLISEARIVGSVIATQQASGTKVTLNSSYIVTIDPFPTKKDETTQSSVVVSLQFPEESQAGIYDVVGELIEAEVNTLIGWLDVTSYLTSSQTMGSVTYIAPDGGDGVGGGSSGSSSTLTPTAEEVKTNLFGTEVNSPISSSGEILETIKATSEDGTLTLTIPEGTTALDKDDNPLIILEAEVDTSPPTPPEDTSIIGLAYDFGPDGVAFEPPITLTWNYDPNDIPEGVAEEDLVLAWYDEAADRWIELVCAVDTESNTITASVKHFTTFAIIVMVTPAPEPEPEIPGAEFRISELDISPSEVDIGQTVTISALVTNTGNLEGTYQVTMEIDNKVLETQEVTLVGGASDVVIFKVSENTDGAYLVNINGLSDSFVVKPVAISEPAPTSTPPPTHTPSPTHTPPATYTPPPVKPTNWPVICGVVAAVVAMGSLLFFLARRSHTKSN